MREVLRLAKRISAPSPGTTIDLFDVPRENLDKLQMSGQNQLLAIAVTERVPSPSQSQSKATAAAQQES